MSRSAIFVVCLATLLPASSSMAQEAPATDPDESSPSGSVYVLPLDDARKDAAPRTRPRPDSPPKSPIRSENNFGSSSDVPGTGDSRADANPPSGAQDGDGAGNRGRPPAPPSEVSSAAPAAATADEGPSLPLVLALIALLIVVGIAAGRLAARARDT